MDPLRLLIALGPLAVYLLAIGWLNLSRRPIVISGMRDSLALAIAVSGLVMVGPVELFMPLAAAALLGAFVWVLLISLYGLVVIFMLLTQRQRLVIYNVPEEVLRAVLADVAQRLDVDARWAGETLALPRLQVELRIELATPFRNVVLVANHERQSIAGWRVLQAALTRELDRIDVAPNLQGLSLITMALLAIGLLAYTTVRDPDRIAQAFAEMLRF